MNEQFSKTLQVTVALQKLQTLAHLKFQAYERNHAESMNCKRGCSQCCHTKLTIFTAEASLIVGWFLSLDISVREILLQNSNKNSNNKCVFLSNNICQIYSARPTICRTQGMAVTLPLMETGITKSESYDICPLNIESFGSSFQPKLSLNLDKLNQLISTIQSEFSRLSAKEHNETLDSLNQLSREERISLDEVFSILEAIPR
jgi:uncharacterized protein